MAKSKVATRKILRNVRNKKDDKQRKRYLSAMASGAAEPRASTASAAKARRKVAKENALRQSTPDTIDENSTRLEEEEQQDQAMVEASTAEKKDNTGGTDADIIGGRDDEQDEHSVDDDQHPLIVIQPETSCRKKDYVVPKRAAAMKRQLEQHTLPSKPERCKKKGEGKEAVVGKRSTAATAMPVLSSGDARTVVDDEWVPFSQYRLPGDIKREKAEQHRMKTLLANLSKAKHDKALPAASAVEFRFGGQKNGGRLAAAFTNIGADIVKVCLALPMWALVHRRDFKRGVDEWFKRSDSMIEALDGGDATAINSAMETAVAKQLNGAIKERVYFEMMANVCNELFKTSVLPNKVFDKAFATIATDNTDSTVRSFSIPKYFRSLKSNVWQKISDTMDVLLTGGASGENSAISLLEVCAENVIARAKSRPVEATIKKAVEQANQAHKLSTGVLKPTQLASNQQQQPLPAPAPLLRGSPFLNAGFYDPYYHFFQTQPTASNYNYYYNNNPNSYGAAGYPPAVTQMWHAAPGFVFAAAPPPPPPAPQQQNGSVGVASPTQSQMPTPFPPPVDQVSASAQHRTRGVKPHIPPPPAAIPKATSVSPPFPSSLIQPKFTPGLSTPVNPSRQHSLNLSPSSPILQPIRTIPLTPGHGWEEDHPSIFDELSHAGPEELGDTLTASLSRPAVSNYHLGVDGITSDEEEAGNLDDDDDGFIMDELI